MKIRLILLATSIALPLISKAQTEKGRWTMGAQIGNLSYANQNEGHSLSISATPSAGYFVTDGLALGMGIPVDINTQNSVVSIANYSSKSNSLSIGLSPFVRYFIGQSKLKPYLGISYSYSRSNSNSRRTDISGIYSSESKGKSTVLIPTLGLIYFINQHLGLSAGLNYNINHDDQTGTISEPTSPASPSSYSSDYKYLSLGIGFQLFIGQ